MLHTLDLFILALITDGFDTPYRWQRNAALSTGATLPAVRRLIEGKFVREERGATRSSRQFTLTPKGRIELQNVDAYLEAALRDPAPDIESLLRLVSIAATGGKRKLAATLLKEAAKDRNRRVRRLAKHLPDPLPTALADFYSAAAAQHETEKQRAAVRCIEILLSAINSKDRTKPAFPNRFTNRR